MARASAGQRRTSDNDEATSILGRGARVRGRVSGDGSLRVEGQIEGDISLSGDLAIEEGGAVVGDLDVASAVVAGSLEGDVASRGPVTIRATAKVHGNMGGTEVSLEEGASFTGRIEAEFDLPAELQPRHGR